MCTQGYAPLKPGEKLKKKTLKKEDYVDIDMSVIALTQQRMEGNDQEDA